LFNLLLAFLDRVYGFSSDCLTSSLGNGNFFSAALSTFLGASTFYFLLLFSDTLGVKTFSG
jgi:hypothetical protein